MPFAVPKPSLADLPSLAHLPRGAIWRLALASVLLLVAVPSPRLGWSQDIAPGSQTESAPPAANADSTSGRSTAAEKENATEKPENKTDKRQADAKGDDEKSVFARVFAKVDRAFQIVVDALGVVLFYDFGSEDWLGAKVPFVVVWLFCGAIFFTVRMGFINVRAFWHAVQLTKGDYDDPDHPGEVSHFQALSTALSATVGLGNIAGVALAVGFGGPGAVFWLVVAGLLGMSSKFAECSLGMLFRKTLPDGSISGGPMHYLYDGLEQKGLGPLGAVLAFLFTVMCIGGSFGGGCAFQVSQSHGAVAQQFPWLKDWMYGGGMATLTAIVILGGVRRIAAWADKIVPIMCGLYVLTCVYILLSNYAELLPSLEKILAGAFTGKGITGGAIGVAVTGIQRAAFSNEAGVGSASIAHSAAKTQEPISEGIVALLEPFVDTVVVCTMTGLVMVITGAYDKTHEVYGPLIQAKEGAKITAEAFRTQGAAFPLLLAATVFLFAFSTVISWSYYGERCWVHLFGQRASRTYKLLFVLTVFGGAIVKKGAILDFSDMMILCMAFPNILGVALLSGRIKAELDRYWGKVQRGELEIKAKP